MDFPQLVFRKCQIQISAVQSISLKQSHSINLSQSISLSISLNISQSISLNQSLNPDTCINHILSETMRPNRPQWTELDGSSECLVPYCFGQQHFFPKPIFSSRVGQNLFRSLMVEVELSQTAWALPRIVVLLGLNLVKHMRAHLVGGRLVTSDPNWDWVKGHRSRERSHESWLCRT